MDKLIKLVHVLNMLDANIEGYYKCNTIPTLIIETVDKNVFNKIEIEYVEDEYIIYMLGNTYTADSLKSVLRYIYPFIAHAIYS